MPHRFVAAVDLGATSVRVAIVNPDGEIEARRISPFSGGPPEDAIARIGRTMDELVRGVWVGAQVAAIGVALPGSVDPTSGTVSSAANLPGWGDVPLAAILGTRGTPVVAENDANAALVGEAWLGAAKGIRDAVFIALGTGIGAGVMVDGQLHRGSHFLAGEVAFFTMDRDQLHAGGWEHCLEGVAGGRAFAEAATELLGTHATVAELFDACVSGDARTYDWWQRTQDYLAMATVSIASLLDPEMIVFGGGVIAAQGERLLAPIRTAAQARLPFPTPIVQSTLGADAQLLGAARLALERLI